MHKHTACRHPELRTSGRNWAESLGPARPRRRPAATGPAGTAMHGDPSAAAAPGPGSTDEEPDARQHEDRSPVAGEGEALAEGEEGHDQNEQVPNGHHDGIGD